MPNTEYDYDEHAHVDNDDEHAHYIEFNTPIDRLTTLHHGKPPTRTYNLRGDWYAVHTH